MPAATCRDHLRRRRQGVSKTRARGAEIEPPRVLRADLRLDETRRARKHHVRRRGADDDEVDVGGGEAGTVNRLARGFGRKVRRRHAGIDNVPLANPRPLENPFIGRLDESFEIGVGEQPRRHVGREARDARAADGTRRETVDYHSPEPLPGAVSPKYS